MVFDSMKESATSLFRLALSQLPTGRAHAVQIANEELTKSVCTQVKSIIRINFANARSHITENVDGEKIRWWNSQLSKWESLWTSLSNATSDLTDFSELSKIEALVEAAFEQYEQMHRDMMGMKISVPLATMKDEARKWRNVAVYVSMLHKHILFGKFRELRAE